MAQRSPLAAVLGGGLVAGVVEIGTAALIHRVGPMTVLRAVASGLFGRAAFHGGWHAAYIGLGLQLAMSVMIALLYFLAVSFGPWLRRHWVVGGLAAGPIIFAVMNFVVAPHSHAWPKPHFTPVSIVPDLAAMILFGLILAWFSDGGSRR